MTTLTQAPSQQIKVNPKDFSLYTLLAVICLGAISIAGFATIYVFPDYKRQAIVYELYVDCQKQSTGIKGACDYILRKLNVDTPASIVR